MTDFITLTCPSCGGQLQITNDIEVFACAHCGTQHVVRRSGGIVSLKPVEGWLQKTASELAISRLEREIAELESQIEPLEEKVARLSAVPVASPSVYRFLLVWLGLALLANVLACIFSSSSDFLLGFHCGFPVAVISAGGILPLYFIMKFRKKNRDYNQVRLGLAAAESVLAERLAALRRCTTELEEHRSIVQRK